VFGVAHILVKLNRYDEAEALQRKVLDTRRRVLGERHPDTVWSKQELARVAEHRGGPDHEAEAIALFREVIEARREVLGPDHFDTLRAMQELGNMHLRARQLPEAEEVYRAELEGWKRALGEDDAGTITCESTLGEAIARRGDFDAGLTMLEDAKARMERQHGNMMQDAHWIRWRVVVARKARDKGSWDGVE